MSISKDKVFNRNDTDYGTVKCSQRKWWLKWQLKHKVSTVQMKKHFFFKKKVSFDVMMVLP